MCCPPPPREQSPWPSEKLSQTGLASFLSDTHGASPCPHSRGQDKVRDITFHSRLCVTRSCELALQRSLLLPSGCAKGPVGSRESGHVGSASERA